MEAAVPIITPELDHPDRERMRQLGEKVRRRLAAKKEAVPLEADRAELWALPYFFDPGECAALMALIDTVAQPSRTYLPSGVSDFRTSHSALLDPGNSLVRRLQRRIDTLLGFETSHAEIFQGQRYTPGQEFKPHTDWWPLNTAGWDAEGKNNGGQRAFTAMVYLNDVHDGGETDFPHLDLAVPPRQGVLLVWNNADRNGIPNPLTVHAGNPVQSETKYIVTRWYRCRQTRPMG